MSEVQWLRCVIKKVTFPFPTGNGAMGLKIFIQTGWAVEKKCLVKKFRVICCGNRKYLSRLHTLFISVNKVLIKAVEDLALLLASRFLPSPSISSKNITEGAVLLTSANRVLSF